MKVLCLLGTTVRPGDRWLWDSIPDHHDQVDFQWVEPRDAFPKWGKLLAYYFTFMLLGLRAAARTGRRHKHAILREVVAQAGSQPRATHA